MRRITFGIMSAAMSLTIAISNICSFIRDGRELDELRNSVLRLHILANSDSHYDQSLKLMVRDALLERSSEIFGEASDFEEARENAAQKLSLIEDIAEEVLTENGCDALVFHSLALAFESCGYVRIYSYEFYVRVVCFNCVDVLRVKYTVEEDYIYSLV